MNDPTTDPTTAEPTTTEPTAAEPIDDGAWDEDPADIPAEFAGADDPIPPESNVPPSDEEVSQDPDWRPADETDDSDLWGEDE